MWGLDYKESWALENWCFWTGVLEDCKEIKPVHSKGNQSWIFTRRTDAEAETPSNTLATWCVELPHLKRLWCWERLKAGGEGDDREWDGWMESLTRWTWVWTSSRSWWRTGKPGILQSWGHEESDTTEWLKWTEKNSVLRLREWITNLYTYESESVSHSVVLDSWWPHEL